MSRAFVKEGDGDLEPLPDLPLSPVERVGARTLDSKDTEKQILGGG